MGTGRRGLELLISGFYMGGRSCPENFCICGEAMRAEKRAHALVRGPASFYYAKVVV